MNIIRKTIIISACLVFLTSTYAEYVEEIVVTGSRVSRSADAGPIVFTTKGDFLLQEINLINDSLEVDERKNDVRKTFNNLLSEAKSNKKIQISRGDSRIYAVEKPSDFELLYQDQNRKGSVRVILKINLKDRSKDESLESVFKNFTNSVELSGRTQILNFGSERISIVNPRQYRKNLITNITQDIAHITKSLGSEYRVLLEGMDNKMSWEREGEDNVTFSLPYNFMIIPESINTITGYD